MSSKNAEFKDICVFSQGAILPNTPALGPLHDKCHHLNFDNNIVTGKNYFWKKTILAMRWQYDRNTILYNGSLNEMVKQIFFRHFFWKRWIVITYQGYPTTAIFVTHVSLVINGHLWPYGHQTTCHKHRQVRYLWKEL